MAISPKDVLSFWFSEDLDDEPALLENSARWFKKDDAFDSEILTRFGDLPERISNGQLDAWRLDPEGILATVICLDQFPRNMYRGSAKAFAYDSIALTIALNALDSGVDKELRPITAVFMYLPLEHSEDLANQQRCVQGFEALETRANEIWKEKIAGFKRYAVAHCEIIEEFGRFPHRNELLNRPSTEKELAFLASGKGQF